MSDLATLARPYAEALFKRSKENSTAQQWSDSLAFLAAVMSDPQLVAASVNPRIDRDKFIVLLLDISKKQIDQEGENLIRLLVQNRRLNLLPQIAELFEEYRADDENFIDVEVQSAFAVTKDEQQQLIPILEKSLKRKVHLTTEKVADLIGGVVIRAGDTVIDASVRGQLQQLAKELA